MLKILIFALLGALSVGFGQTITLEPASNPAGPGSIQPNWSATPDGGIVLSWIEPNKAGAWALRYAVRRGATWQEARTVIDYRHFFRHAAEMPEVIMLAGGSWLAHW